jgi:hypothetical protein
MLVELEKDGFPVELAQQLVSSEKVFVDAASALGCSCSGVTSSTTGYSARIAVTSLEPARATAPIIVSDDSQDLRVPIEEAVKSFEDIDYQEPAPVAQRRTPMAVTPVNALRVRTHSR